jgi:hypothetical protein
MSMAKPSLMSSIAFKAHTTSLGTIKRSNLAALDAALAKMDFTPLATKQQKIGWLQAIIAECINWRANKAAKLVPNTPNFSQNTAARARVVDQVGDQAMLLLKYYTFEDQKAHRPQHVPQAAVNRRGLQAGHEKEKGLYDASKGNAVNARTAIPVNFPGGSLVDANMHVPVGTFVATFGALPPAVAAILNGGTAFHQLNQAQFDTLANYFDANNLSMQQPVHYSRKEERINEHMVVVINGLIRKEPHQNYTTALDMWAMDKYGNFMCTSSGAQVHNHQYNHSSLNAGNDVLCAGTVVITNGVIMEIDNNSGHYRPTRQNLHTAVQVLHHDLGVTFAPNCVVKSYAPPQPRRFQSWNAFVANVNAAGVWP